MNVKELIAKLQTMDPETVVYVDDIEYGISELSLMDEESLCIVDIPGPYSRPYYESEDRVKKSFARISEMPDMGRIDSKIYKMQSQQKKAYEEALKYPIKALILR